MIRVLFLSMGLWCLTSCGIQKETPKNIEAVVEEAVIVDSLTDDQKVQENFRTALISQGRNLPIAMIHNSAGQTRLLTATGLIFFSGESFAHAIPFFNSDSSVRLNAFRKKDRLKVKSQSRSVLFGALANGYYHDSNSMFMAIDWHVPFIALSGANSSGQLGVGHRSEVDTIFMTGVHDSLAYLGIEKATIGSHFSVLLDENGQLWASGSRFDNGIDYSPFGSYAQLKDDVYFQSYFNGLKVNSDLLPSSSSSRHNIKFSNLYAGSHHTLFIDDQGILWGSGDNRSHQLGDPSVDFVKEITPYPLLDEAGESVSFIDICAADTHSIALDTTGTLWVVGDNRQGQLGVGGVAEVISWSKVIIHSSQYEELYEEDNKIIMHAPVFKKITCHKGVSAAISEWGFLYVAGLNQAVGSDYGHLGLGRLEKTNIWTRLGSTHIPESYDSSVDFTKDAFSEIKSPYQPQERKTYLEEELSQWLQAWQRNQMKKEYGQIDEALITPFVATPLELYYESRSMKEGVIRKDKEAFFINVYLGKDCMIAVDYYHNLWVTGHNSTGQLGTEDFISLNKLKFVRGIPDVR